MYACTHVCMYGWMDVWMDVHVHTCRKHVYGIIISLWISRFQVHTMQSVHWLGFLRCLTVPLFRSTCGFRDFGLGFWGVLVFGFAIHLQFDYTLNSTAAFQTYRRLLWESVHLIKDLIGLGFRVITTPPRTSYCKALRPRFNSLSLSLSLSFSSSVPLSFSVFVGKMCISESFGRCIFAGPAWGALRAASGRLGSFGLRI